jgi:hypothetical protein
MKGIKSSFQNRRSKIPKSKITNLNSKIEILSLSKSNTQNSTPMAFSQLTQLTEEQYKSLNLAFSKTPTSSSSGSPDPRASVLLGGWAAETVMAFRILTAASASTSLVVDPSLTNTIDINIVAGASPDSVTTYWTVDTGTDARSSDWSMNFQVAANNRNTGTWVFVKGKLADDQY